MRLPATASQKSVQSFGRDEGVSAPDRRGEIAVKGPTNHKAKGVGRLKCLVEARFKESISCLMS